MQLGLFPGNDLVGGVVSALRSPKMKGIGAVATTSVAGGFLRIAPERVLIVGD